MVGGGLRVAHLAAGLHAAHIAALLLRPRVTIGVPLRLVHRVLRLRQVVALEVLPRVMTAQVREGMVSVRNDWALKQTALEEELLRLKTVEGQRDQEWMQERDKFVLEGQAAEAETKKDREMMQGLKEQLRSALIRVDTLQQEQEERDADERPVQYLRTIG